MRVLSDICRKRTRTLRTSNNYRPEGMRTYRLGCGTSHSTWGLTPA